MKQIPSLENWCELPTKFGLFRMYDSGQNGVRIVTNGDIRMLPVPTLVRIHSSCTASELFSTLDCDCTDQLQQSMRLIADAGHGIIIHLRQEGRGHGISKKIEVARLMQTQQFDTVEAFDVLNLEHDPRQYPQVIEILKTLDITEIHLITNNPKKIQYLSEAGITVTKRIGLKPIIREENCNYLLSKKMRLGHEIDLPE